MGQASSNAVKIQDCDGFPVRQFPTTDADFLPHLQESTNYSFVRRIMK